MARKSDKNYVVSNECDESFVGTLEEIQEWIADNNVHMNFCKFYELGAEVNIKLVVEEK